MVSYKFVNFSGTAVSSRQFPFMQNLLSTSVAGLEPMWERLKRLIESDKINMLRQVAPSYKVFKTK